MTRQRYSAREALNRILRLFEGKAAPSDAPGSLSGEVLSEDGALSDLAELFAASLPNETLTVPTALDSAIGTALEDNHTAWHQVGIGAERLGSGASYIQISSSGTFQMIADATAFEDLRIDGLSSRVGVVAPTDEVGFRGDSNFLARNFVHTQADEVQFNIQLPHAWKEGGKFYPHVHFSPWITGTAAVQAARFILEYRWSNPVDIFPSAALTYNMTYTWTGSFQWRHLIALNATELNSTGKTLSSVLNCRLYRDNTVGNNLAGKATFLYFDVHYEVDSFGSNEEYRK